VIKIPEEKIELVQKFVDAYHATQDLIDSNDISGATTKYGDLLNVYKQIASSKLDPMHKELAYDQLVKTYNSIKTPPQDSSIHATTHIIAAAILLMLFSFMVFFKPVVFGAVTADISETYVQDLNWAFVESGARNVHLEAVPQSLKITGKVDGNGFAKVYALTPDSRLLVFDRDKVKINSDGTFTAACINTCAKSLGTEDITLVVELDNSALTIYSMEYTK
jgi:hypothetical protein